jgi:hypothetical protein
MGRPCHVIRDERREALISLKAAVSQLVLTALKHGASSTEILDRVGRGIDSAAQVYHGQIEPAPSRKVTRFQIQ